MKKDLHILMLEDDSADAELTRFTLSKGGVSFSLVRVDSEEEFLQELEQRPPTLILSDYSLPNFDGYRALSLAREHCPETPFIFVTGTMGEEVAIETLKSGATDYVLKTRLSRLVPAVHRAMREAQERAKRHRAEEQLRQSHEQLRALSVYLQSVREEERTRIAREVHDELGQALTSCKLDLSWIAHRLPREPKSLLQKARELSDGLDATIGTVRRISSELRPGVLDHLGLAAALEWQANEFQNRTGIKCEVIANVTDAHLPQELNTAFFRIFQEALTNIIRHAGATRVNVRLKETARKVILHVQDNGRGITESDLSSGSLGLLGMRERAALLGGHFKISRMPKAGGTHVTVSIPIEQLSKSNDDHENSLSRRPRSCTPWAEADSR